MTLTQIDERLRSALLPIEDIVYPEIYTGEATEYIVYNYNVTGVLRAESRPQFEVYTIMVHLYVPHGKDSTELRPAISRALHGAGCTWPEVTDAGDADSQHWVFECEALGVIENVSNLDTLEG